MSVIKEEIAFSYGNKNSPSVLTKTVIGAVLVLGLVLFTPSIYSYLKQKIEINTLKKFDRYEAIGGRTYQGLITALNYVSADDKTVINVELEANDTLLFLNHAEVPPSTIRPNSKILTMNRFFAEAIKSDVVYVDINVTTYENKFTKDKFHLIMDVKEIPPIERKVDMDNEQSIFRHPDTYEIITKEFWQEIMKERKEIEEFKASVAENLNQKPNSFSKYTKPLLKGWINDKPKLKPVLINGKCLGVPYEYVEPIIKEVPPNEMLLRNKYNYEYMISATPINEKSPDAVKDDVVEKLPQNSQQAKSKRKVSLGV